jgi:hypothetical protein
MIDERWEKMTEDEWKAFARAWMEYLREPPTSSERVSGEANVGTAVVFMNFTSRPQHQWAFIVASMIFAESDDELAHIAAGPVEHLLGNAGEEFITLVEQQAAADPKFARMLTGVWKYTIPDAVWARV